MMFAAPSRVALLAGALLLTGLAALAASGTDQSAAAPGEHVFDLPNEHGSRERVLFAVPPHPKGVIVMLPGGTGDVGIERDGNLRHGENFVIRTRSLWLAQHYAVLIPDTLRHESLRGLRSSPLYAALVRELIGFGHSNVSGPVFLLGTSQGSIAAMNGAAHAPPGQLAGVVLTESVSRLGGSHETIFGADPQDVRVPALIVANREDRCDVAPPEDAPKIAKSMANAPEVEVLYVSGGVDRSKKPCGSFTPHGYYGIEQEVVKDIAKWMDKHQ